MRGSMHAHTRYTGERTHSRCPARTHSLAHVVNVAGHNHEKEWERKEGPEWMEHMGDTGKGREVERSQAEFISKGGGREKKSVEEVKNPSTHTPY
jgi:hypothetical protein